MDEGLNKLGPRGTAVKRDGQLSIRFSQLEEGDSSLITEILTVEEAMELVIEHGWTKVCFVSDSLMYIEAINSNVNDPP